MKQFVIKIKDIKFEAENREDAESVAVDIVNDIAGDGRYKVVAFSKAKKRTQRLDRSNL